MQRLKFGWMVVMLAAAACSSDTGQSTTTEAVVETTITTTVMTTTVAESTTTKAVAERIDICRKGTLWNESRATYVADCFFVPVSIEPQDEGWRSARANEEAVLGSWVEPGQSSPTAHYVVLAYEPSKEPGEVVDSITSIDGVNAASGPVAAGAGEVSAVMVDLVTDPIEGWRDPASNDVRECSPAESPLTNLDYANYPLLFALDFPGPGVYVLAACRPFRVWVLDVGDAAITVVWTPDDPDRFDELVAVAERFVDSMTFEAP